MLYIVVYDVSSDEDRDRIREVLKNWGGSRIQYSAFKIRLEPAELNQLLQVLRRLLGEGKGSIMAIPVCKACEAKLIEIAAEQSSSEEQPLVF